MNPQGALLFLLGFVIDLYIFLVLTRFLLQLLRADFYNPVSQFVVKATNPALLPLRKVIPGYGGVDVAALVIIAGLVIIKIVIWTAISPYFLGRPTFVTLAALSVKETARLILNYAMGAIFIRIILSWLSPDSRQPIVRVIAQLTEPVMAPARKMLPPMGMIDLSPMLIILAIFFLKVLFGLAPLQGL